MTSKARACYHHLRPMGQVHCLDHDASLSCCDGIQTDHHTKHGGSTLLEEKPENDDSPQRHSDTADGRTQRHHHGTHKKQTHVHHV
jgi:hypothetical protein